MVKSIGLMAEIGEMIKEYHMLIFLFPCRCSTAMLTQRSAVASLVDQENHLVVVVMVQAAAVVEMWSLHSQVWSILPLLHLSQD
jgi:hypothetical protein